MLGSLWQAGAKAIRALSRADSSKVYRGMGSLGAMGKGSSDRYFQAEKQQRSTFRR